MNTPAKMTKQDLAAEFLGRLRTDILNSAFSEEEQIAQILGLFTAKELERLNKRDAIRNEINKQLDETGRLSISGIMKSCGASEETVRWIWRDMRDEYPPTQSPSASLRIAIPKSARSQERIEQILLEAGFRIEITDRENGSGRLVDIKNGMKPVRLEILAGDDIPTYMKRGVVQAGFLGNDILEEITAEQMRGQKPVLKVKVWQEFLENSFRMCFAVPKQQAKAANNAGLQYLQGKEILTSYPETAKLYLENKGITPKGVTLIGSKVEKGRNRLKADAIVDIVETGGSLKRNNLTILGEPLYRGSVQFFSLEDVQLSKPSRDYVMQLNKRLQTAQPARLKAA